MTADAWSGPGRWARVQEVLGGALEREGAARAAYLAAACAGDDELLVEVESLLAASRASAAYFDDLADRAGLVLSPPDDAPHDDDDEGGDPRPDLIDSAVGQYHVVRWLGRGGMASVYLAEREGDGFTQRVALKIVLKPSSDPAVQKRSNAERRILARLEHRNIARLIDGGLTAEGHPFYAMEYVEGIDLLAYCDERRLGVKERLELFLEVCAPVQFAHERLIVHCDLKPSNILVTGDGHVKLLDFGVARLVDPDAEGDEVTGLWFTPAYASPEQVHREPPGTASDVYSLGVLLYEMLTGHRPYRFPSRSPSAVVQTVGAVAPQLPSKVVGTDSEATRTGGRTIPAGELAASRRSTPERMRKRLRGDLDAIVLRALAKDPGERYHTAEQLAADIRRHLGHRPVSSRTHTARYRLGKLVRRNRSVALAAALVLVTLGAGVGATLWQAARATDAARVARAETESAARMAALMTDLFRLSDPNEVLGDTITARDLLDRGTERIRTEFGDQPVIQAQLLAGIAKVYQNLGLYRRAEPLARQALELRTAALGPTDLAVTESLIQLGSVQADLGLESEAIETLERALAVRAPLVRFPDSTLIAAQGRLAWLEHLAQRHDRAEELFRVALAGQQALDPHGVGVADMTLGLASTYHDTGMLAQADSLLRSVIESPRFDGTPSPMAIGALSDVGMMRRVREEYRDAEPLLRTALDMAVALYGNDHPTVFEAKAELGMALWGTGAWDEAEDLLRGASLASSSLLGPLHRTTTGIQEALATVLVDRGEYDEAVVLLQLSLQEMLERHGDRDHPAVVASLVRLAEALTGAGRYPEARAYIARAQGMNDRLSSNESVYAISMERSLGTMAMEEGDSAAAEAHYLRAIDLAQRLLSRPDHRYTIWAKRDYARFLTRVGRRAEAVELLRWALDAQIRNLGEPHPMIDRTRRDLRAAGG